MKNLKLLFFVTLFAFSVNSIFAQAKPGVIAIVTKAKWCSTCVKNESRVDKEVLSKVNPELVNVIVNDLSDKETKATSASLLESLGLENLKLKSTGVITFVNSETKEQLKTISLAKSSEEITEAFEAYTPR